MARLFRKHIAARPSGSHKVKLGLELLEARDVPALYSVQLTSPTAGLTGDSDASITGSLVVDSQLPADGKGGVYVNADSAAQAVQLAVIGTVTVNYGNQALNYATGAGSSTGAAFAFTSNGIALEDLAGSSTGSDWDYNDHYWNAEVEEFGGGEKTTKPVDRVDFTHETGTGTVTWKRKGIVWSEDEKSYVTIDINAVKNGKDGKLVTKEPGIVVAYHTETNDWKDVQFIQFEKTKAYQKVLTEKKEAWGEISDPDFKLTHPDSGWVIGIDGSWIVDTAKKGGGSVIYPGTSEFDGKQDGGVRYMFDSPTTSKIVHDELKKKPLFKEGAIKVVSDYFVLIVRKGEIIGYATYTVSYVTGDATQASSNGKVFMGAPSDDILKVLGKHLRAEEPKQKDIDWKSFPEK